MAFLRIKDWLNTITAFRTGDVIPVDGPSGTAKMGKDDLLKETAENAIVASIVPAFDPTRTSVNAYKAGEICEYGGKLYRFKTTHYGAWNASDAQVENISNFLNTIDLNKYGFAAGRKRRRKIPMFEVGGIDGSGVNYDRLERLRTKDYLELEFHDDPYNYSRRILVHINDCTNNVIYYAYWYDENKDFLSLNGPLSKETLYTPPLNAKYARFIILRDGNEPIYDYEQYYLSFICEGVKDPPTNWLECESKPQVFEDLNVSCGLIPNVKVPKFSKGTIVGGSGVKQYSETRLCSDFFEVTSNFIRVRFNNYTGNVVVRVVVFNSSKQYESFKALADGELMTITAGKFVRFIELYSDDSVIDEYASRLISLSVDGISLVDGYTYGADEDKFLQGKKVVFIGDSITYGLSASDGKNYVNLFGKITGSIVVNKGMNSTCIANNTTNGLGSDRFVTRATSADLDGADLVVVFGGTNDFSYDSKPIGDLFVEQAITPTDRIGSKELVAPTDTDTFAGALHDLITTIQDNAPNHCKIMFMTPMQRGRYMAGRPTARECNVHGDYLSDFAKAIKEICAFYAVPVFDLYSQGLNPLSDLESDLFADTLHPNTNGHYALAKMVVKFVKNNITLLK